MLMLKPWHNNHLCLRLYSLNFDFFNFLFFLLIRPQQKAKRTQITLDSIKRGDEILTSGGIVGKVTKTDAERLNVDIAKDVNVIIYRSTVVDVLNKK